MMIREQIQHSYQSTWIVQEAVDAGINFMDNTWEYNEGKSEEYMGKEHSSDDAIRCS